MSSMKIGNTQSQPTSFTPTEEKKSAAKTQANTSRSTGFSGTSDFVGQRGFQSMPDLGGGRTPQTHGSAPQNTVSLKDLISGHGLEGLSQTRQVAQTTPGTTTPVSTPEEARAQAQADVALLAQKNEPLGIGPRDVAGLISSRPQDTEYVAQLMGVLHEEGEFATGVLAAFNSDETPGGQQTIMAAVQLGLEQGTLPRDQIDQLANDPIAYRFGEALRTAQAAGGDPATLLQNAANSTPELRAAAVEALTATAATAESNLESLNQQLSRELARYGPAMDSQQRQAFIEAFKANHAEYQTALGAQEALGTYLQANQATLQADALSNPEAAANLFHAMESLAGSSQNAVVVDALKNPQLATALQSAGGEGFAQMVEKSVGTLAAEGALSAGGDRQAQAGVAEQLNELYSSLSQVPGLGDDLQGGLSALRDTASALRTYASNGNADALFTQLNRISDDAGATSGLGRAMAGANFLLGASLIAEGALTGNPEQLMEGLVQAASNADAIGYGLELASKALPNMVSKGLAAGAVGLTEKVAGVVGVISNTISFLDQLGHLDSDSDRIKAASSFASAAGGALLLIPGGQIPGAVLTAVGAVLGLVGEWQAGREQEARNQAFDAEALQLMRNLQPPLDPGLLDTLSQMSPEEVGSMQGKLAMTPEQWVRLSREAPALFAAVNQNGPRVMEQLSGSLGLDSYAAAQRFMSELAPPGTDPAHVAQLFRDIAGFSTNPQEFYNQFVGLVQQQSLERSPTPTPSGTPTPTSGSSSSAPTGYAAVLQNMLDLLNERR